MGYKLLPIFCVIFQFITMFTTNFGPGPVGAEAASRYGSGSDEIMRLLAAPAAHHWVFGSGTGIQVRVCNTVEKYFIFFLSANQ
jgi:hypothetical protein